MSIGRKLTIAGVILAAATAYTAYLGASAGWKYYLTADECLANAPDLLGVRLRVSGRIASGTLQISPRRDRAEFALVAGSDALHVLCHGAIPDNLTEEIEVVVEGRMEEPGKVRGEKILTRCASKYESQQPGKLQGNGQVARGPQRESRR